MLFELLFEFLLQVILETAWEAILRGAFKGVQTAARRTSLRRAAVATGAIARGAATGWLSFLVFPHPFTGGRPPTGLSLVLVPTATAATMWAIGRYRARHGSSATGLLTFWLAFDFAFAMAVVRFFLLNPHPWS